MWTMDELVDRVRQALAAEYSGAPNGRVRDVPDRRAIRWYTSTGLVDRPLGMQGRTAIYGPRHLLQIVAVKRRQAQGHALAAIQAELTGVSDEDLATVARVPADLLAGGNRQLDAGPARPHFWTQSPARAANTAAGPPAAEPSPTAAPSPAAARSPSDVLSSLTEIGGVALGGGAFLVLPVRPTMMDIVELSSAARPLLTVLVERGLLHHSPAEPHPAAQPSSPGAPHDADLLTTDDRSAS